MFFFTISYKFNDFVIFGLQVMFPLEKKKKNNSDTLQPTTFQMFFFFCES